MQVTIMLLSCIDKVSPGLFSDLPDDLLQLLVVLVDCLCNRTVFPGFLFISGIHY